MKTLFSFFLLLFSPLFAHQSRDVYIVNHKCHCSFSVAGYDFFPKEPLKFPIELGDQVLVENEHVQLSPALGYTVTADITSLKCGEIQQFTSRIINDCDRVKIKKAIPLYRNNEVKAIQQWNNGLPIIDFYIAEVAYDLILEDDSLYKMFYRVCIELKNQDVEKLRAHYFDPIVVCDGDEIELGEGFNVGCHNQFQRFSARIFHEGLELPSTVGVVGHKRKSNSFHNKRFTVTRSEMQSSGGLMPKDIHVVEFDDFGKGCTFTPLAQGNLISKGMTLEFVRAENGTYIFKTKKSQEIPFKMKISWHLSCFVVSPSMSQDFLASFHRGT